MEWFLLVVMFLLFAAVIILNRTSLFEQGEPYVEKMPYKKKDYLLTIAERNFFNVLEQVAKQNNYLLFCKVRLEDLLWLPKGVENRFGCRNRVKSRHIDFVLCDRGVIKPLLAIELDDSSHDRFDRLRRDDFVDDVLKTAGLPLLRFKARNSYDLQFVSQQVLGSLTA